MKLEGSCHCRAVTFTLESGEPCPYMRCYCSICRKTAGGGGYSINLGGDASSLKVDGEEHVTVYQAKITDADGNVTTSPAERRFCRHCGSFLWAWDPRWPELVHPFASAIDTDLPAAPEHNHIMLNYKPGWVPVEKGPDDGSFDEYPEESLAEWHRRVFPEA